MSETQTAPAQTGSSQTGQHSAGENLLRDIQSTATAFDQGDWLQGGMGVVKVAMDVMDIAGDPLGAIGGAGIGWVLGAISFLREPFDVLKGNSGAVSSSAQSWGSSGSSLASTADLFRQSASDQTRNWAGTAADGYRAASNNQSNAIQALAQANQAVSGAMQQGGQAVAAARKSVMDLISDAVQKIIQICIEALSKSWMSFGASIAEGIAKSVQQAVQTAQKMAQKIQSLIQTLQKIIQVVQKVVQIAQQVKELVELIGGKASADQPHTQSTQQVTSTGAMATNTNPNGGDVLQAQRQAIAAGYQYSDPAMASGGSTTSTQTAATNAQYRTQELATGGQTTSAQTATTTGPVAATPVANGTGTGVQSTSPQAVNPVAPVAAPPAQAGSAATGGPVSQNGWPVNPPRGNRMIPGTNTQVNVVNGPGGDVLMHVLGQVNSRVENIDMNSDAGEHDDWGYANRNVRGSHDISNHASATAVDVNATRHVLGATNTFTPTQINEIHNILGEVDGVVRWGGDYTGRHDEMHFEIVGTPDEVARVAERLRAAQPPQ